MARPVGRGGQALSEASAGEMLSAMEMPSSLVLAAGAQVNKGLVRGPIPAWQPSVTLGKSLDLCVPQLPPL